MNWKILFVVALVIAVTGCSSLHLSGDDQGYNWKEPFFLVQMADPQFGMISGNANHEKETELFTKAIEICNRIKPAFVVVCGDMINKPGDDAQAQAVLDVASKLDKKIPLHWVPGNHELTNDPKMENLLWYRKTFGKDRYEFHYGGCFFMALDTALIKSPKDLTEEASQQREWLVKTLSATKKRNENHIIIFQHHPWFLKQPDEKDEYSNMPLESRKDYLSLFQKAKVTAAFAGHRHANLLANDGTMLMVTTSAVGKPLAKDPSGMRIVKVFKDHIEHEYYGLDDVPEKIELNASKR